MMTDETPISLKNEAKAHFTKGSYEEASFGINIYVSLIIAGVIWLGFSITILYIFLAAPQFLLPLSFLLLAIIALLNIDGILLIARARENT